MRDFYIRQDDFRVFLPEFEHFEKSGDDAYNSRKIRGIMSTSAEDRQGEHVLAKGLDLAPFLKSGHFNDNHDQATGAVVGYPEEAHYSKDLQTLKGEKREGWVCGGYLLKGTKRSDEIWELAKALSTTPDRRLGFSIEGKVTRRSNNVIEKASIRNVAVTNCPVNTDATWDVLAKSFCSEDIAMKALSAGYGGAFGPAAQSGGSALGKESLDDDEQPREKKKKRDKGLKILMRSFGLDYDDVVKALDYVHDERPDFTDEAAAEFVRHLLTKGVKHARRS